MSVEKTKNRDLHLKIAFMYFLTFMLIILGIDEEIVELKPIEYISMSRSNGIKIFNNFLDYCAVTKSNKIILFEFKKDPIRKKDLKQACKYSKLIYCKEKMEVMTVIITISKIGKLRHYTYIDNTFHPRIIKTKTINKQKDLKIIRDKFKNNLKLSLMDCALIITLPLFDLAESEDEIVREMCEMISAKRNCFPDVEIDGIIMAMYLNVLEYIEVEQQEKYVEMINMAATQKGVIALIQEDGMKKGERRGFRRGKKEIISNILLTLSIEETASLLGWSVDEVNEVLND